MPAYTLRRRVARVTRSAAPTHRGIHSATPDLTPRRCMACPTGIEAPMRLSPTGNMRRCLQGATPAFTLCLAGGPLDAGCVLTSRHRVACATWSAAPCAVAYRARRQFQHRPPLGEHDRAHSAEAPFPTETPAFTTRRRWPRATRSATPTRGRTGHDASLHVTPMLCARDVERRHRRRRRRIMRRHGCGYRRRRANAYRSQTAKLS